MKEIKTFEFKELAKKCDFSEVLMPMVNDFVTVDGLTAVDVQRINRRINSFIFNPRQFIK